MAEDTDEFKGRECLQPAVERQDEARIFESPRALVSAVRETSVVFAALIATVVLKERAGRHRILAAVAVALGLVLIRAG